MDAVCHDKRWDVLLVESHDGTILAALPYLLGRKGPLRYILQPQLTQYNGPWFSPKADIPQASALLVKQLHQLRLALFLQHFAPGISPLPEWKGYTLSKRITYRIEDISNPAQVFAHFDKSRRQRQIRRAEKLLHPVELSPEHFARFHRQYWEGRGEQDLLTEHFMVHLIQAALDRGQGLLLGVADDQGTLMAARFVVYDSSSAYSLLSALHPRHPNGASALLFWLIIQQLSGKTQAFDFEGSMHPTIAYSYQLYGAQPATYYQVMRCPSRLLRTLINRKK